MGYKLVAVGLLVLIVLASLSEAYPTYNKPAQNTNQNIQTPQKPVPKPDQGDPGLQSKQVFQKGLQWRFPTPIVVDPPRGVEVEIKPPKSSGVRIYCDERQVLVEVDMDFFKTGQLIDPALITLGGCPVADVDQNGKKLLLQSELHTCGSILRSTDKDIIYSFTLIYKPGAREATNIIRGSGFVIGIECHYRKNHNVSSGPLLPNWKPYSATKTGEEMFLFFMQLMTDDLQAVRATRAFNLGDMIYIQAYVIQFYHVPLSVYVDSCVASATADPNVSPTYAFIDNAGCMIDAKLSGTRSQFLQRTRDDTLTIMLEAFKFPETSTIYITCRLKATPVSVPRDSTHKACSYIQGTGWAAAGGPNEVCSCCDRVCSGGGGGGGAAAGDEKKVQRAEMWADATVGPITIGQGGRMTKRVP
uniref:Zona pellucida sperm-binding protein 3 n=1 Tax=Coilia nasus TaxID=365059 RepID=A0A7R7A621_COINA|nr:egg envelope protein [Coilia nasus]